MALQFRRETLIEVLAGGRETVNHELFIKSAAHELLRDELQRHLGREIAGRSILIAGHRGSGKTMLVQTVVDQILNGIFKAAEERNRSLSGWREPDTPIPRRPLLVKLHGPSLLGDMSASSATTPGETSEATMRVHVTVSSGEPSAPEKPVAQPPNPIQSALVQVTIALYRALSAEVSLGFTLAAQESSTEWRQWLRADDGLAELPARLRLELDSGAEPALLRDCWSKLDPGSGRRGIGFGSSRPSFPPPDPSTGIGRLGTGVLWPSLFMRDTPDRGYREIAALATAGQAFRICTGAVTASQRRSDRAERSETIEVKGAGNFKAAIDRLFALAVGVGVGLAVHGNTVPVPGHGYVAALAGLVSALASALTLNWSASRSTHDERAAEYSFLPDLSVQSLDRDLPLVIERIREVGLAPVFVVDEVDKLDRPDEAIRQLMRRLKQLTADYGFFCFLADRDYYERLQALLKAQVFPEEHTYFAHRLLMSYRIGEIAAFLRGRIGTSLPEADPQYEGERFAGLVLGRVVLNRSELNLTQLNRELAAFAGPDRTVNETEASLRSSYLNRLEVLMQLAIEHAMRSSKIAARIDDDSRFAQIAADALFMISRLWRDKSTTVDVRRKALEAHLLHRMRLDDAKAGLTGVLSDDDVDALAEALALIAACLCDFSVLRREIDVPGGLAAEDRPLLAVFEPPLLPLLRVENQVHVFQWDRYGIPGAKPGQDRQAGDAYKTVARFLKILEDLDVTVDDLVRAKLLPVTFSAAAIQQAARRVSAAAARQETYPEFAADHTQLTSFLGVVEPRSSVLGVTLSLVEKLRDTTNRSGPEIMQALRRYVRLSDMVDLHGNGLREGFLNCLRDLTFDGTMEDMSHHPAMDSPVWSDLTEAGPSPFGIPDPKAAWDRWLAPVSVYLRDGKTAASASCDDLVLAAMGTPPGSIFRCDLAAVSVLDWSTLTLEGALFAGTPAWAIPAGLFALGFDAGALEQAISRLGDREGGGAAVALGRNLIPQAPLPQPDAATPPGRLEFVPAGTEEAGLPVPGAPPVMQVREDRISTYAAALDWLRSLEIFGGFG